MLSIRIFDQDLPGSEMTFAPRKGESPQEVLERFLAFFKKFFPSGVPSRDISHITVYNWSTSRDTAYERSEVESYYDFERRVLEEAVIDARAELKQVCDGEFPWQEFWIVGKPVSQCVS